MVTATGLARALGARRHCRRHQEEAGPAGRLREGRLGPLLADRRDPLVTEVAELERAVLALEALDLEGLRAAWRQRWGLPPRLRSIQLLRHLMAWRIQAEALGGLDKGDQAAAARHRCAEARLVAAARTAAGPRVARPPLRRRDRRQRVYSRGQCLQEPVGSRPRHHRHPVERSPLLWPAGDRLMATATNLARARRCAIYTRKSSEEGLEQSFNSLHAQREACEAYIKSQTHEGWRVLAQSYNDGGFSGGSMERPGLVALLSDVEQGKVDVVVVYKVDRLTRSLTDFGPDCGGLRQAHGVLCLGDPGLQHHHLDGKADPERSAILRPVRARGHPASASATRSPLPRPRVCGWAANLPLGYDRQDNTLMINTAEAAQVKAIFERYLELSSVDVLRQELAAGGVRSKSRTTRAGKTIGGTAFSRGALYHLLTNRHYRGMIRHKDQHHAGLHPAIIDETLFDAVQCRLAAQRVARGRYNVRAAPALLTGRIVSENGSSFTPSFSYGRGGRLYRYYIAERPADGDPGQDGRLHRLPAEALETFIKETLAKLAGRPDAAWSDLDPLLVMIEVKPRETHLILDGKTLFGAEHPEFGLDRLRERLAIEEQAVGRGRPAPTATDQAAAAAPVSGRQVLARWRKRHGRPNSAARSASGRRAAQGARDPRRAGRRSRRPPLRRRCAGARAIVSAQAVPARLAGAAAAAVDRGRPHVPQHHLAGPARPRPAAAPLAPTDGLVGRTGLSHASDGRYLGGSFAPSRLYQRQFAPRLATIARRRCRFDPTFQFVFT